MDELILSEFFDNNPKISLTWKKLNRAYSKPYYEGYTSYKCVLKNNGRQFTFPYYKSEKDTTPPNLTECIISLKEDACIAFNNASATSIMESCEVGIDEANEMLENCKKVLSGFKRLFPKEYNQILS